MNTNRHELFGMEITTIKSRTFKTCSAPSCQQYLKRAKIRKQPCLSTALERWHRTQVTVEEMGSYDVTRATQGMSSLFRAFIFFADDSTLNNWNCSFSKNSFKISYAFHKCHSAKHARTLFGTNSAAVHTIPAKLESVQIVSFSLYEVNTWIYSSHPGSNYRKIIVSNNHILGVWMWVYIHSIRNSIHGPNISEWANVEK